jgi:C_GCAxxG_C_C family probable redox protein
MDDITFRLLQLNQQGYCCSQIMLLLSLEAQGKTNVDLVRSMAGLCFGIAMSGEICGAFTGGACLISLYTAKGGEADEEDPRNPLMMSELAEWFRKTIAAKFGGIRCDDILERHPDKSACGSMVASTYNKVMEILTNYGIDPYRGKDD